ncbi:protein starmaker [Canna indica]|uniref:Protein starmaker n=1 Tax=Canna indica TaxID=4628 RepID=A0AAQ3JWU1_9LILI|nr:protein starmaker [Canna indica]
MSSQYPVLNNKPIDQWKVTELKEELRRRKIAVRGLKEELVRRLFDAIRNEEEMAKAEEVDDEVQPEHPVSDLQADGNEVATENSTAEHKGVGDEVQPEHPVSDLQSDGNKVATENSTAEHKGVGDEVQPEHPVSDLQADGNKVATENSTAEHINIVEVPNEPDGNQVPTENSAVDYTNPSEGPIGQTNSDATVTDIEVNRTDAISDPVGKTGCDDTTAEIDINQEFKVQDIMTATSGMDDTFPEEKANVVSAEDSATESHVVTTDFKSNVLATVSDEKDEEAMHEDSNIHREDIKLSLPESDNQVSVDSPDLGSQVKCESIPIDSVSIIEKNNLKDNLNADDFHLEQEVVKPEMVQPSSSSVPSIGGDLQTPDDAKEQVKHLDSLEDTDAKTSKNFDLSKKEDNLDEGSPEKLNLDRSSSDELMEEDVLESKQVESNIKSEEPAGKTEVKQEPAVEERANIDVEMHESISGKKDIVDEGHGKPNLPTEKRKLEDNETVVSNEVPKRQRRWNTEMVKVPERQPSNLSTSTPKNTFGTPRRAFAKSDSKPTGDSPKERIVPPSQKPATTSLRIDKFLRPFTLKAVQELLAKTGTVCSFWMDHIKTHCYVTYSSVEEANATRNAVYNLQWPPNGGNHLVAEFVDPQEVKARVEALPQSPAPISSNPNTPKAANFQQPLVAQPPTRQHSFRQQVPPLPAPPTLSDPPTVRERLPPPPPPLREPEPPALTLDDLFKKTKATPRIYYLPLSEKEVASKLAAQGKSIKGSSK